MSGRQDAQPLEVWRGGVTLQRCDEMGHMNMRHYLAIAEEGLATLACELGQPRAFARGAASTLQARRWHVRFLREARAGEALYATAGLLGMGAADARALVVVRHADGAPAANLIAEVDHAAADGRAFAWSGRARAAGAGLMCQLPADAGPRGAPPADPEPPSAARADRAGFRTIARGAVMVEECDAAGQMTAAALFGRVADGTTALFGPHWPVMEHAHPDRRIGSAALEYALDLRRTPRLGDLFEVRSGFARIEAKTVHPRHWLLDPAGGEAYGSLVGVGAALDLDARRILTIPASLRQAQLPYLP